MRNTFLDMAFLAMFMIASFGFGWMIGNTQKTDYFIEEIKERKVAYETGYMFGKFDGRMEVKLENLEKNK